MRIQGRRFHIAGSANSGMSVVSLQYAHQLVTEITKGLACRGARFMVGVGKDPLQNEDDLSSPSTIFDWTVLATINTLLQEGSANPSSISGRIITTVATHKTEGHVPQRRRETWDSLKGCDAVQLEYASPNWTSGAVRRMRMAGLGDVLIALGGGEGVEHLVQLYRQAGKPVIPLDLELGASMGDGFGGASRLAVLTLTDPGRFSQFLDPNEGSTLFAALSTQGGTRPTEKVVQALLQLIDAITEPTAFYVRLLNKDVPECATVERFYRTVVDPTVEELGYIPIEAGRTNPEYPWLNEEIFGQLHHSQVALVDLTGLRANVLIELGYALGRQQHVIVTAAKDTTIPFDLSMLGVHFWSDIIDVDQAQAEFRDHWLRNIDRPPLVEPRQVW